MKDPLAPDPIRPWAGLRQVERRIALLEHIRRRTPLTWTEGHGRPWVPGATDHWAGICPACGRPCLKVFLFETPPDPEARYSEVLLIGCSPPDGDPRPPCSDVWRSYGFRQDDLLIEYELDRPLGRRRKERR